jgi:hypothetical protein
MVPFDRLQIDCSRFGPPANHVMPGGAVRAARRENHSVSVDRKAPVRARRMSAPRLTSNRMLNYAPGKTFVFQRGWSGL